MVNAVRGVGLGLRRSFVDELLVLAPDDRRRPDFLEIVPENWMFHGGRRRRLLDALGERFAIVPHSVSLDVGGGGALDARFLDAAAKLADRLGTPFWSDHVCWASLDGRPLHELLPLPLTDEAAEHVGRRAREAAARIGRPLVLENATFYAHMPASPDEGMMDEADFLLACAERGGFELLLDVNNVFVNSQNHGFDPRAFIDRIPMERVRYLHLAGHTRRPDGVIIDTHIGPIIDEVWALYRHTLVRAGRLVPTLIEWDQDIPPLDVVLDEVDRARAEARAALEPAPSTETDVAAGRAP